MTPLAPRFYRFLSRVLLNDPDYAAGLAARYSSISLLGQESLNQLCRWFRLPLAFSLTTVGIETNNTCNLACRHCPVPREMKRPRGLMSLELFRQILEINPGIKRIYLTDWGEPLLHPGIEQMVAMAHSRNIHVSLTTNATLLDRKMSLELLRAGLDLLKVSVDGGPETYERIRGFPYPKVKENISGFLRLREERQAKTWVEVSMVIYEETVEEVTFLVKEWGSLVDAVNLQPKFFTLTRKKKKACRDRWRILVVLWDGRVTPCCADYDGELILGQAKETPLACIFNGPAMRKLRREHLQRRWSGLCSRCILYEADYHLSRKAALRAKTRLRSG